MNHIGQARLHLILSVIIFGTLGFFVRFIPLPSGEVALFRALIATFLLSLYFLFKKETIARAGLRKDLPLLAISGIAMGINWLLLFRSFHLTSISLATLAFYTSPVLVTIASHYLFHEAMTRKQVFCMAMSILGLVLIMGTGKGASAGSHMSGILFALSAAVFYSAVILINKTIKDIGNIEKIIVQLLFAIAILIPFTVFSGGIHLSGMPATGWLLLLVVGAIHTAFAYILYFGSLRSLSGEEASVLSYIDPLVAIILSVLFLKEGLSAMQVLGGTMILVFTLANDLQLKNPFHHSKRR